MASALSRREFLKLAGVTASTAVLAACVAAAPGASSGGAAGGAPAATIDLKWDTFRGPGTGWNEERIDTFKQKQPQCQH